MNDSHRNHILHLASRTPLLSGAKVIAHGYSPQLLRNLHREGKLERTARGVYTLPDQALSQHHALAVVSLRIPKAVICLLSALELHQLGTQLPSAVWIALPEGTPAPTLDWPTLRIVRMRGAAYAEGIETIDCDGTPLRVYGVAKTLADCFKFRNKTGLDVALEATKEAWREHKLRLDELQRFAQIDRVGNVMRPYLEAIVA